jgi:hypothetical protein
MQTARNKFGREADFAWRGMALLISIEMGALASKLEDTPVGPMLVGGLVWAFIGFRPRRPWLSAFVTSMTVLVAALVIWNLPKTFAIFVPVWAAIFFLPTFAWWGFKKAVVLTNWLWDSRVHLLAWTDSFLSAADRHPTFAEISRITVSIAGPLAAIFPFFHDGIMGGDDARWYTAVVADHISQWRSGMGPAFVGQTQYAALGTVLPLRIAPYLQHLTLALDFLTGQRQPAYLLLNLAIVLSAAAGGLSAYLCLRSLLPLHRTEACLLALLYSWCPAVIGLAYNGQLFMSAMTWPYLPIIFLGMTRLYDRYSLGGWVMLAAGCAMAWLCHSPIGLWATIAAALAVAVRWLSGYFARRELFMALLASVVFAVLCGYAFVSMATLSPDKTASIATSDVITALRTTVPGIFLPLSPGGAALSDFQPGYSLWLILGLCVLQRQWKRPGPARSLAAVALLLVLLLLPIPGLNAWLWDLVPQSVIDATNRAPGQRLYALLAAGTVILAAVTLRQLYQSGWARRSAAVLTLLLATLWSGIQLRPFLLRGPQIANSTKQSDESLSPQNLALGRYSIGFLSEYNRFFSNGVVDYNLEQRILGPNLRTYIETNVDEIAPGFDHGPGKPHPELPGELRGHGDPSNGRFVVLAPTLRIEPNSHCLLVIDFLKKELVGVLEVRGRGILREYALPLSGEPFAFGTTRFASRAIPLENQTSEPLDLTLTFINQGADADPQPYQSFARYELVQYDPEKLPIRLRSYLPYVADVNSPGPGWLETFRYFTPGWKAVVNGNAVPVRKSWNQLVAVPVGAGENSVSLFYQAPVALAAAYWITWTGWLALVAAFVFRQWSGKTRQL